MSFKNLQFNFEKIRPWLTLLAIAWLLASLGLGWLVNSLMIIFGLLLFLPVVAFFGFRWWLQKNLVTNQCPVCGCELTGLNNRQVQCANCGEQLLVKNFQFQRFTPEGTIDVTAVEVQAQSLED
jgi:DNA-directed RNA polymerase subunit RPC12/RpoP